jgi:secretion/DNA translocation related TadE-like protein
VADRDEGGAVTVVAVALAFALSAIALGVGSVAGLVVAHRVAQTGADLAALAAAADVAQGADGCATAREVVEAHHASLVQCTVNGHDVTVVVRVQPPVGPAASARAMAGPEAP